MNWDPFQRAVLAELGHVAYRLQVAPVAAAVDGAGQAIDREIDPAMLARLARAAGTAPEALLAALDPGALAVRGDAGAKRALWPRLRALRRATR